MRRMRPVSSLLVTLALLVPGSGNSAEWERSGSVSAGTFYTDNVCLAAQNEQDKVGGTITPNVRLRGTGSRGFLALNAAAEYNSIADSGVDCSDTGGSDRFTNREPWVPRVNMTSQFEAVENTVFLEANAFASQNAVNPFRVGGDGNINAAGNTNITYRWGAGARLDRRFSEHWRALVRYNYNEQYNTANQSLGDSQEDRVTADIGMIPGLSRFSTGVRGQYSEVKFEETAFQPEFTNRLSRAEIWGGLSVTNSILLNASVGREDNVFLSELDDIDGEFWDAGLTWNPNARVQISAGYGERFFGETPRFNASYRHKRSTLQANYQRDIQFPRNIRAGNGGGDPDDPFDPGVGFPGDPLPGDGNPTFIGQSPVLTETFSLSYRFSARRTNFGVNANDSSQTRVEDGRVGEFLSVSAFISRNLGPRLSANLRIRWNENQGQLAADDTGPAISRETITVSVGLQRQLLQNISANLNYSYREQTSNVASNEFAENRVDLGLTVSF